MSAPHAHTLEEHRDYLYEIVKLKLFFLHKWLEDHPEEDFRDVIRNRVDIYRKTDANRQLLNPDELYYEFSPWKDMEDAALELYTKYKDDRQAFEDAAFEVFRASIDARCEKDYLDVSGIKGYQCGSLRYNLTPSAADSSSIGFHIANAVSPKSIFEDPRYLPECFMQLMDEVQEKFGVERIETGTWLNSHPRWLSLFPAEWHENMSEANTDIQWHYGFWGQFISARHTFNKKAAAILRETGKLPYYLRCSNCSIENMREHLKKNFL